MAVVEEKEKAVSFFEKVKLLASSVWDFIAPFVKIFLTKAGQLLAKSAIMAVQAVAISMEEASGSDKRDAAFGLIVDDLKRQGVVIGAEITTSLINAAIEAAVQKLKAN